MRDHHYIVVQPGARGGPWKIIGHITAGGPRPAVMAEEIAEAWFGADGERGYRKGYQLFVQVGRNV